MRQSPNAAYEQKRRWKRDARVPGEAFEARLQPLVRENKCHQREHTDGEREAVESADVGEEVPIELRTCSIYSS